MRVTWTLPDGTEHSADVAAGQNLMAAALSQGIAGIMGECGGCLSCATCHVIVDPAWADRTGTPGAFEEAMLDVTEADRAPASRLSCQIAMRPDLDGLRLFVPAP